MILETERTYLRKIEQSDFSALCKILQDKEVMYAYEHAFSCEEVQEWLDKQLKRYNEDGFGLWAVILKDTNEMIGQCGITMQEYKNKKVPEIGYLFQKAFWHQGYAAETAVACKEYAFNVLNIDEVYSIIRDNNITSQNVAKKNGMTIKDDNGMTVRGAACQALLWYGNAALCFLGEEVINCLRRFICLQVRSI